MTYTQEAPVSITFGQHISNQLKIIYLEFSRQDLSIDICMGQIGGDLGGVRVLCPPSKKLLGHSYRILNISSESSAQAQSIGTLFGQIGLRGGSVDMSKSQRHTRSGAGRGVSQASEAAINPKLTGLCQHEIVSENVMKCGTVQNSYGCLGHVCMGVRISVFSP